MSKNYCYVTRHEEFETAHLLPGYNGKCKNLHGHSYKIEVTIRGYQEAKYDMVMDFKELSEAIKKSVPDHKFVLYAKDNISLQIKDILEKYDLEYEMYSCYTTAENMVKIFAERINKYIHTCYYYPKTTEVCKVKLWETSNSYAEWRIEDNE